MDQHNNRNKFLKYYQNLIPIINFFNFKNLKFDQYSLI